MEISNLYITIFLELTNWFMILAQPFQPRYGMEVSIIIDHSFLWFLLLPDLSRNKLQYMKRSFRLDFNLTFAIIPFTIS